MKWIFITGLAWMVSQSILASDDADFLGATPASPAFSDPASDPDRFVPGSVRLTAAEIDALIFGPAGKPLRLPSLDAYAADTGAPLEFIRFEIFANESRVRVVGEHSTHEIARDTRDFYIATQRGLGIGLAVDPVSGETRGFVSQQGRKLEIKGNFVDRLEFHDIETGQQDDKTCSTRTGDQPIEALLGLETPIARSVSAAAPGELISYQATVAIETDSEWLAGFADDEVAAQEYITELFLAMNVFFERDVETRLLIGDVFLRTGSDPYSESGSRSGQLNEFGEYWMENMGEVYRQFAAMLSGRDISRYGFSGIAWINQYCKTGRVVNGGASVAGSYSYNAIGASLGAGAVALYVGHELGHNMGSRHTHCYNPPVDQCYNGEGGCFDGDPVCPASGRGTVMSYCHVGGSSGAGCGTSEQAFHPTVQELLESRLADELTAGCIEPYLTSQPEPEFDASPAGGGTLDFGEQLVGTQGAPLEIRVENLGGADLSLNCELSGAGAASFDFAGCRGPIRPGGSITIDLSCAPTTMGSLIAVLTLQTNDIDEARVDYSLECDGTGSEPPGEMIFSEGFENP